MSGTEPREKLQDLVAGFDDAMLVTRDAGGTMAARPMHVSGHDERSGTLTFASSIDTEKVAEIRATGDACVTFQSGARYVSLSGRCTISQDRERIRELFDKAWETWFPEGPEQADICLIEFRPVIGEYWDQSGTRGLSYLWKAASALARGESAAGKVGEDPRMHGETSL